MSTAAKLSVQLDPPQARLSRDAISTLVSGRDWDPTGSSNVWIDPVTNTLMLEPGPVNAAWTTSNSGIYAKWNASSFGTLTDSGNWQQPNSDPAGSFMYYNGPSGNTSGLQGVSSATLPANQGMSIEYFPQKATNGRVSTIEFGWSNTGDGSAGVSLRIYSDGSTEVWKAGSLVGSYSGGGKSPNYFDQVMATGGMLGGGANGTQQMSHIKVMVLPCRDRELLVISSDGACFCHVFQDLPEGIGGQTILDNATFWFLVPAPVKPKLRFGYLQFAASGTAYGAASAWRLPPPGGSPNFAVFQSLSQGYPSYGTSPFGLVTPSIATPATNPYAIAHPQQIEVGLTGVTAGTLPAVTPFVYGVRAYFDPLNANTVGAAGSDGFELLPYLTSCRFDVSDTVGGTKISLGLMQPLAIGTEMAAGVGGGATAAQMQILTQCHRPLQVFDEAGMILNGITEPPHWEDSIGFDGTGVTAGNAYDKNQELTIQVRDMWKAAEEYFFSDPVPLDGMSLAAAYALVAGMIGIAAVYVSPAASSFFLPLAAPSGGEWAFVADVGDKGSEVLDRLHQTYASTWFHGFRPNGSGIPTLSLIDPADVSGSGLPTSAAIELYESAAAAVAGGVSSGQAWKSVYRSYKQTVLEPEANDVYVVGRDPRGGKPIVAHKADVASQTVTTGIASRPSNWLGFVRKYSWVDPAITTIGAAQAALSYLFVRLSHERTLIEWECEYLPGLWRGDLVTLHRPNGEASVTVRIKTFSGTVDALGQFDSSAIPPFAPDAVWRPCRYVGEVAPSGLSYVPVHPLDVFGTTIAGIAAQWHTFKALTKQMLAGDRSSGQVMAGRPVMNQQEL